MTTTPSSTSATAHTGLAKDLPFETIPTYPVLHFFARHGKLIAGLVLLAGVIVGFWAARSLGTSAAAGLGLLLGAFLGFVLLVLSELVRALVDIMLPR